jgi:hypothetical protein
MLSTLTFKRSLLVLSFCLIGQNSFAQLNPTEVSDVTPPADFGAVTEATPAMTENPNVQIQIQSPPIAALETTDQETISRLNKEMAIYKNDLKNASIEINNRLIYLANDKMLDQPIKDLISSKKYQEACSTLETLKVELEKDKATNQTKITEIEKECRILTEIIYLENLIVIGTNKMNDNKLLIAAIQNKKLVEEKEAELAKIKEEKEKDLAELAKIKKEKEEEVAELKKSHKHDTDVYNDLTCKAFEESHSFADRITEFTQKMVMPMLAMSAQQTQSAMQLAQSTVDYSYRAYQAAIYGVPSAGPHAFKSGFGDPMLDFWGSMAFNNMMSNNIFSGNNPMGPQVPFMGNPQMMPGEVNFYGPGYINPQQVSPSQFFQRGQQMMNFPTGTLG